MLLYRIHQRLLVDSKRGVFVEAGPGCVHALGMVSKKNRALLLQSGAISIVQAPPLDVFTGWKGRARKFDSLGIDTIGFITMDAHDVAYALRASGGREIEDQEAFDQKVDQLALVVKRWQCEIKENLGIGDAQVRR